MSDLHITPQGQLRDEDGTFDRGTGYGLLNLVRSSKFDDQPGKSFFREIFTDRVKQLSSSGEPEDTEIAGLLEKTRPSLASSAFQVFSVPPITGAEYFTGEMLYRFHQEFETALQQSYQDFSGNLTEFIRSLSSAWENVGKVTFHLAENKGEAASLYPFAFMASFIYRVENDRPRHLPLSAALKTFAGNADAMKSILEPIVNASRKSEFLEKMLESRRIFQPSAWTAAEAYAFLKEIPVYEEANIIVRLSNLWKNAPPKARVSVSLDVRRQSRLGKDSLLDFSVDVMLGGEPLSQDEIDDLLKSPGGLVRIKGQWVEADPVKITELLRQWKQAEMMADSGGISLIEGLRMLAGAESGSGVSGDFSGCSFEASGELKRMLSEMREPGKISLPFFPDEQKQILRPYQTDGVKYLWRTTSIGLGACLADDMGLGKTLQLLTLIRIWKQTGELKDLPALLVLPATLLGNWKAESAKFTPDLKIITLHSSAMDKDGWVKLQSDPVSLLGDYDLALVTYGMLPRLPVLSEIDFPAVIADEAQAIKNPTAKQSRAVRSLHGKKRIALTGTPVENRLTDLWSIFDFVNPGLLGGLKGFLEFTKKLGNDYSPLRRLTQPFILRRLKTDKRIISDLPDKTEVKVYCHLTARQAALYTRCAEQLEHALQQETEGIKRRGLVLAYLMRFKQICNHPGQFLGTGDFSPGISGKFQRIAELVEPIASRQEKVLVFTQFREMTEPIHDHLRNCFGRSGLILHGGTPVKERAKLVREFQRDDGPPFFVLSLKAAGVGLNLTAASHVIHFDRWWNPAVENQASDRAYRIGQKRNVLIHKFICKGTLEEKIDALISDKQNLADELLRGGAEKLLTDMSNSELLDIIKLNIDEGD